MGADDFTLPWWFLPRFGILSYFRPEAVASNHYTRVSLGKEGAWFGRNS